MLMFFLIHRFGMYHGISMLVNLASMVLNIAFVTLT